MVIKALVAVRSGSERVSNKNIRSFAGTNLLEHKLEQLKRIPELDGIVVNSNDDTMLEMALKHGVEAVKRDSYYASSSVLMNEVYENMAQNFSGDLIVYANVTNPLLKDNTISNMIKTYLSEKEYYDSINSSHPIKEFLFLNNQPINYSLEHQPRSQDLPDISALNFAISIIEKETMIKYRGLIAKKPFIYTINSREGWDIDDEIDFEIAEYLYLNGRI